MRTNIDLDDQLVKEGMRVTNCHTKRALVTLALQELVRRERRKGILKFLGSECWQGDLAAMRRKRW